MQKILPSEYYLCDFSVGQALLKWKVYDFVARENFYQLVNKDLLQRFLINFYESKSEALQLKNLQQSGIGPIEYSEKFIE